MSEIIILGQMDNSEDHTHESANRVYSTTGICPVITTFCGGGQESKILTVAENCISNEILHNNK